jgi:glycosyltransferase involved in cell wall biosynthesis
LLRSTLESFLACDLPVLLVLDGSDDGSPAKARAFAESQPRLTCREHGQNCGKGAAVETGLATATELGWTHALVADADGQHLASALPAFLQAGEAEPQAVIYGRPVFGDDAPMVRLYGRELTLALTRLETQGRLRVDTLFGYRLYPIAALREVFADTACGRRYDFDPEVAVRLCWRGWPAREVSVPCPYVPTDQGGVSHFHYLRDNLRMIQLHLRLGGELLRIGWPAPAPTPCVY